VGTFLSVWGVLEAGGGEVVGYLTCERRRGGLFTRILKLKGARPRGGKGATNGKIIIQRHKIMAV